MNVSKKYILTASILGSLAVIFGAMAAHALEPMLKERALDAFKTASRYQMYHALAFLILAVLQNHLNQGISNWIFKLMLAGTILFSGSIYILTTAPIFDLEEDGKFEGYANRDSLSYRSLYGLDDVETMYRGTLRRPGFCKGWDVFVQLGLTDFLFQFQFYPL